MTNPNFQPTLSTNEIWRDVYSNRCLTDDLDAIEADIDALQSSVEGLDGDFATADHTHTGYATTDEVDALVDAIASKADATHTHTGYASTNEVDALENVVAGKADVSHTHTDYASLTHSHNEYATINALSELSSALDGKSNSSHTHDDRYYTESEVDAKLSNKSDVTHTHPIDISLSSTSDNPVQNKVVSAALDSKVPSSRTINGKPLSSNISLTASDIGADASGTAATQSAAALAEAKEYADDIKDDLLNGAGTAYDTLKELGDLINSNTDAIDALETVAAGKANAVHTHNYAGSSSVGGAANSADKLNTNAGSATNPVYFQNGVPVATTHTIAKSVPANAVFTDTTYGAATANTAGLMSASDKAKLYGIANGANNYTYTLPTASSTLGGVKTTSTVTSSSGYTACPIISGVPYYKDTNTTYTLGSFGVTATADELNKLDGVTATAQELNYVDGVTSNIQTQLNGKAASSHTHNYAGSSSTGGAATSANKLATARTITLTGDVTGSTSFDGSGNVSITATVADDSHNHTIANVDGLQSALDGKSATNHNHNSAYVSKDLQFTDNNGGSMYSYLRDDGKNILTEIAAYPIGFYTVYSQSGTTGNPKTTEAWRFMVHKTGANTGWVQGYGSIGSVYTNYLDGSSGWRGWKCIWDNDPNPLWSGQYYMSSPNSTPQTVTPSKKLSECRTGWLLLWSDYDAGSGSNDSDFVTTVIPKNNPSGGTWGGKSFLCDIPRYVGSNAEDVDTERRIIKPIYVHDDCIKGSYQNDKDERNDVVLRAVYEI